MSDFQPYFTNDGSVGLYSQDFDDIYHSASGALTEAYEKFIYPINWEVLLNYDDIKILDICYGIGYNTKSFFNYIFENKKKLMNLKKNIKKNNLNNSNQYGAIYTNNILVDNSQIYNDTIHTDNIYNKITVTAIDNDEILFGLSPFIQTGVKNFKNNSDILDKHDINKYLNHRNKKIPKINDLINFQILSKMAQNSPEILQNPLILSILSNNEYNRYFKSDFKGLLKSLLLSKPKKQKRLNLHNIYYRYLSYSYKRGLKRYKIQDFDFSIKIDDARNVVKDDKNLYNLIFLDAFTPSKCPCLWTYEFFKCLYKNMEQDGMLFTYSSAAQIRSAMIEAGFEIGNIYNERLNKFQGTVAVKNKALINHPISEADLGLLNTRAGIFYRDENLTAQNEAIIAAHKTEVDNSHRISSSQYLKARRKNEL